MSSMRCLLRVLLVGDSDEDASCILRELRRGGFTPLWHRRAETEESMRSALRDMTWDIILSDTEMRAFSGLQALRMYEETGLPLPFVFLCRTMDEKNAHDLRISSACDVISRDRLDRLAPAVRQMLRHARHRQDSSLLNEIPVS
jgi:DNA-binding NtrC family response regulator